MGAELCENDTAFDDVGVAVDSGKITTLAGDSPSDLEKADRARLANMLQDAATPEFQRAMLANSTGLTTIIGPLSLDTVAAAQKGDTRRAVEIFATAVRIAFWFGMRRGQYMERARLGRGR